MDNIVDYLLSFVRKGSYKPTIILLYAVIALSLWKYIPAAPPLADANGHLIFNTAGVTSLSFLMGARKIIAAFFLMGVFPWCIIRYIFKENPAEYGLCWGNRVRTVRTFLMFLPFMIVIGALSGLDNSFYSVYPYNPWAGGGSLLFGIHALCYFVLYYLAWEFMFRGFIQHGMESSCGASNAVLIQIVLTTMLHYGHPFSEVLGTILGGLIWGFLVYRTGSIFSGWWQHAILGITLDFSLIHSLI